MKQTFIQRSLAIGALALVGLSTSVFAQTTLTVSSWGSPNHGINRTVWPTWGQWVAEATEGRVTLNVLQDLAPPQSQMDILVDNIADVTWLFHGLYAGRFESTKLPELPTYKAISSEEMSKAYWQVHEQYLSHANEHVGVVVLGVGVHGPGTAFSKEAINSIDDFQGMRMRSGGGLMGEIAKDLGIAGVALPPTGVPEAASQSVITGALLTLETLKSMRLADVFDYAYVVPGGLYRGSFSIVVSEEAWNNISPADQEAIMAVSGEKLSALFGAMMDEDDQTGMTFGKDKGMSFVDASAEDIVALKAKSAPLAQQWIENNANSGYDSQAAFDAFKAGLGLAQE